MKFETSYVYTDRRSKARYFYQKYRSILSDNILEVGADQCYLKDYLDDEVKYVGIGLHSSKLDLEIDLENQKLPYKDSSFETVICLDVLEHLDNLHEVFDELCRVSKKHVIISLPNCYAAFIRYLKNTGISKPDQNQLMKFYGLPFEKPRDRHKWFFNTEEAERFIQYRAQKNNMEIVQIDVEKDRKPKVSTVQKLRFLLISKEYPNLTMSNRCLHTGRLWAVLKKSR